MKYKVSVIVPIYKVEPFIKRCADSLFSQSLDSIEYIFVDDCSPDNSISILENTLKSYPTRIKDVQILHHNKNKGSAAARNTGILSASGEFIIFCDSDDWVDIDMYEIMYNTAIRNKSDIVVCDFISVFPKKNIYYSQSFRETPKDFLKAILNGKLHNGLWNKLIKRSIYNQLDFLWIEGINMWEDVSIIPRIAFFSKKVNYLHKAFYHYNQQNLNSYTTIWSNASINNVLEVVKIIDSFFALHSNDFNNDIIYFKLNAKSLLIQNISYNNIKKIKQKFSEANPMIFNHPTMPLIHKIKLWCCFHSLTPIGFMIAKTINIIKKIARG